MVYVSFLGWYLNISKVTYLQQSRISPKEELFPWKLGVNWQVFYHYRGQNIWFLGTYRWFRNIFQVELYLRGWRFILNSDWRCTQLSQVHWLCTYRLEYILRRLIRRKWMPILLSWIPLSWLESIMWCRMQCKLYRTWYFHRSIACKLRTSTCLLLPRKSKLVYRYTFWVHLAIVLQWFWEESSQVLFSWGR